MLQNENKNILFFTVLEISIALYLTEVLDYRGLLISLKNFNVMAMLPICHFGAHRCNNKKFIKKLAAFI